MTGDELQAAREQLGLSLAEFARVLGLTGRHATRTLRAYESGRRTVPQGLVAKLDTARRAGIKPDGRRAAM